MKSALVPHTEEQNADLCALQAALKKRWRRPKVTKPEVFLEGLRLAKARYVRAPKPVAKDAPVGDPK
jgi:hypothetical protein